MRTRQRRGLSGPKRQPAQPNPSTVILRHSKSAPGKRKRIDSSSDNGSQSGQTEASSDEFNPAGLSSASDGGSDVHDTGDNDDGGSSECDANEHKSTSKSARNTKAKRGKRLKTVPKRHRARKKPVGAQAKQDVLRLPFTVEEQEALSKLDPWARARRILHVGSTPAWLPCREEEFAELEVALGESIDAGSGCCLYISGVPGTGKTATVHAVIRTLQAKVVQGNLSPFKFFEINGMKVTEPSQAFVLFWEFLSTQQGTQDVRPKRCSPREAMGNLETYFRKPCSTRETCVLLVDELDQLVTRKQEVIYNFFNWPNQPNSRLIVVAVANKMDLPETELNGKIRSRLGSNRIQFKPYTHHELMEILNMRLDQFEDTIFVKDAIQWVSKKIASLTGDVRKALDLCRSTVERVEKENEIRKAEGEEPRLVQVRDVIHTYEQMIASGASRFIKQLSVHQSIMLLSISKAIKMAGIPEVEMGDVISRHTRFSNSLGLAPEPSHEDLIEVISSLQNMNLILNESSTYDYFSRIKLEVKESDLNLILQNDRRFSKLAI